MHYSGLVWFLPMQGELLQGRLQVSSYHPRDEATVVVSGGAGQGEELRVPILGTADRGRAIHNDRVAVRLLHHSQRPDADGTCNAICVYTSAVIIC